MRSIYTQSTWWDATDMMKMKRDNLSCAHNTFIALITLMSSGHVQGSKAHATHIWRGKSSRHKMHVVALSSRVSHNWVPPQIKAFVWLPHVPHDEVARKSISTLGQKGRLSKRPLKGSKHAINFFNAALPHRYLLSSSSYRKCVRNIPWMWTQWEQCSPEYSLNAKKIRNVGSLRAMLTRKDSEWRGKFEEPWQSRPHLWRGVGHVFLQGRVKVLASSL